MLKKRCRNRLASARLRFERLEQRQLLAGDLVTNLSKFQTALTDSVVDGTIGSEAIDGIVSNDSRWVSQNNSNPHWLEVRLPTPYPVGSAQVYLGENSTNSVSSFLIQYHNGSSWQTITSVTGNNSTDHNLVFPSTISTATRFRIYTTAAQLSVKEFVLMPPNGPAGFPLGTGVNLNLGSQLAPGTTTVDGTNYATHAVDGYVADDSRWLSENVAGTHRLAVRLPTSHEVGSVHLYTGEVGPGGTTINSLSDFTIQYSNNGGSSYTAIPGGTVSSGTMTGGTITGNTSGELVINFATPVLANRIRISFTSPSGRVRELVALPANTTSSGTGYPIGTSVQFESPPTTRFTDFGDAWYRLVSRENNRALIADENGATQTIGTTSDVARQYQVLYSYALDAYRIRAEDSGKALQVAGASLNAGAAIVEGDFSAAPHQLWRLLPTDSGFYQFVNVWSGMALETGGAYPNTVTQVARDTAANPVNRQEWKVSFRDDYFKKGTASATVGSFGTSWSYDWARGNFDDLSDDQFYVPMQFREGWPDLTTLHQKYEDWNDEIKPAYLLGFNEPDKADQANMTVATAVDLWPRLLATDIPLVSPANAHGTAGQDWLEDFTDQTDALGYRMDYAAAHWYSSPSVNSILNYANTIQTKANGRDVWMTEFAVVDWTGGSGGWSEETNYNFILEFLYRAETQANLNKYSLFLWTGAQPTTPWEKSNPRSDFFISNTNKALTPFGKAYSSWDGNTAVENETLYLIHNRQAAHRLQNDGSGVPNKQSIRVEDDSVQWIVQDAGNSEVYITSADDGRRLKLDAGNIVLSEADATGWGVRWKIQQDEYGWQNIIHSGSGGYLQLNRVNDATGAPVSQTLGTVTATAASSLTNTDWWFVKPYVPATGISAVVDVNLTTNSVAENLPIGAPVGVTTHADGLLAGDQITYSLTNNAGGRFVIDPISGVVTTNAVLDFAAATSHVIEVTETSSDLSTSSATFTINVLELSPPSIESIVINEGASQRSSVDSVRVTFDRVVDIDTVNGDPFQFVNTTTGQSVTDQSVINNTSGKTVINFTFNPAGLSVTSFGSLVNGNYQLTIVSTMVTSSGAQLDGNGDGNPGDNRVSSAADKFFRKFGDDSGDNLVALPDFAAFRAAFGKSQGDVGYKKGFDSNGDDIISLPDFAAFRQSFGS